MKKMKYLVAGTVLCLFLLISAIPVGSAGYESTGLTPREVYENMIKDNVNAWDSHASLILVWGLEYGEDNYIFPDWGHIPSLNSSTDKSRIVGDSRVGDGRANIWLFVFYSKSKRSLCEIRAYLNPNFGWITAERILPTLFDYSTWRIDLKSLEYSNVAQRETLVHLLWKSNNSYGWLNYESMGHREFSKNLNKVLCGENFDLIYMWESSMAFVENMNMLYPFPAENLGVLILPDYGEIGDFNAPTYLLYREDKLGVIYPSCEMDVEYHINSQFSLKASKFDLSSLEENLKESGFLNVTGITYGIFTYSFCNSNGNDTLSVTHRIGSDAIESMNIDLEQYENVEKGGSHWVYYSVTGATVIGVVTSIFYIWQRRRKDRVNRKA